jgi:hypothetical protein
MRETSFARFFLLFKKSMVKLRTTGLLSTFQTHIATDITVASFNLMCSVIFLNNFMVLKKIYIKS